MSDQAQPMTPAELALKTATETLMQIAPVVLAGVAATNPNAALALQLAPMATQMLQLATQLTQAGAMTSEQLVQLFATIGGGIQTTHDQWVAINAAAAKPVEAA